MQVTLAAVPTPGDRHRQAENLGLRYLAAVGRAAGHNVELLEATDSRLTIEDFVREVARGFPDVVGLAVQFANQAAPTVRAATLLREALPSAALIAGGQALNFGWEDLLEIAPAFTAVACFEAEGTFASFLRWCELGRPDPPPSGLYLREDSRVVFTGFAEPPSVLDDLPFPARDVESRVYGEPNFVLLTSRGCQSSCTFCSSGFFGNRYHAQPRWRTRSVGNVMDELSILHGDHGARAVSIVDDDFFGGKAADATGRRRARGLATALGAAEFGLAFSIELRADETVAAAAELTELSEVGLAHVLIGVDALTQRDLKLYSKRVTFDVVRDAVSIIAGLGLSASFGAILFNPLTTPSDLTEGIATLQDLGIAKSDHLTNKLQIYRGSPLVSYFERQDAAVTWDPVLFRYDYPLDAGASMTHAAYAALASEAKPRELAIARAKFRLATGMTSTDPVSIAALNGAEASLSTQLCEEATRVIDKPGRAPTERFAAALRAVDRAVGCLAPASAGA